MDVFWEILAGTFKTLLTAIAAGLVCGLFVSWQAKRRLDKREFLDRVNFSLNILKDDRLLLRTLIEKPRVEVFQNAHILKIVDRAAAKTTEHDSLLPIEKPDDYWLCLNAMLNEVSEKFSDGFLRLDMNACDRSEIYVMCLTCEVSKNIKTRKIRAMLIKKSVLMNFPEVDPAVDYPTHTTRIVTLRQLAREYTSGEKSHCFVEIELCA